MEGNTVQSTIQNSAVHEPQLTTKTHWSNRRKSAMRYTIASLCLLSELIHLWLLPEQYETFSGYGVIFLLIALAQGFIGVLFLFEVCRRLITFALWINILVAMLYIFTHTIGVLVGLALLPLPVDVFGIIATGAEIIAIVVLFLLRRDYPRVKRAKT